MLQDQGKTPWNSQSYSTADARDLTQVGVSTEKWCVVPLVPAGSTGTVPKGHESCVSQTSEELRIVFLGPQCGKEMRRRISDGDTKPKHSNGWYECSLLAARGICSQNASPAHAKDSRCQRQRRFYNRRDHGLESTWESISRTKGILEALDAIIPASSRCSGHREGSGVKSRCLSTGVASLC